MIAIFYTKSVFLFSFLQLFNAVFCCGFIFFDIRKNFMNILVFDHINWIFKPNRISSIVQRMEPARRSLNASHHVTRCSPVHLPPCYSLIKNKNFRPGFLSRFLKFCLISFKSFCWAEQKSSLVKFLFFSIPSIFLKKKYHNNYSKLFLFFLSQNIEFFMEKSVKILKN